MYMITTINTTTITTTTITTTITDICMYVKIYFHIRRYKDNVKKKYI
jgi:hypothetical protein